jgi:hypothetical protein
MTGHDAHADPTTVDNAVDSWGYLRRFVDERALRGTGMWKPGEHWGRRSTRGSDRDQPVWSSVHNPQPRRRQQDLFARMTGDVQ